MKLPKGLRTDDLQLSKLGFARENLNEYIYVPLEAKGWKVYYIEELKGYFIAQSFQPLSFIPCEYLINIIQFGELVDVKFTYDYSVDHVFNNLDGIKRFIKQLKKSLKDE